VVVANETSSGAPDVFLSRIIKTPINPAMERLLDIARHKRTMHRSLDGFELDVLNQTFGAIGCSFETDYLDVLKRVARTLLTESQADRDEVTRP
jgi:hypothetical protein